MIEYVIALPHTIYMIRTLQTSHKADVYGLISSKPLCCVIQCTMSNSDNEAKMKLISISETLVGACIYYLW